MTARGSIELFSKSHIYFCILALFFILFQVTHSTTAATTVVTLDPYYNTTCQKSSDCNDGQYICLNNQCMSCESSSQCERGTISLCQSVTIHLNQTTLMINDNHQYMTLDDLDEEPNTVVTKQVKQCVKKNLWPIRWQDIAITAVCFIGGSFAASAGIGGGGIYVPAMLLLGGYSAQVAVPLSTVMIFGCAIANFLMLAPNKHPTAPNRPVINYTAALIFQPIILCGSALGVMLNTVIPNWFLVIALFTITSYTTYKTTKKGLDLRRKENEAAAAAAATRSQSPIRDSDEAEEEREVEDNTMSQQELQDNAEFNDSQLEQSQEQELQETSKTSAILGPDLEKQQYPILLLVLMSLAWIVVFVVSLLNGSKKAPSLIGIKQCSPIYWVLWFVQYPLLFGYSMLIGLYYHSMYKKKVASGYKFEDGDIHWTRRNSVLLPFLFMGAGLVAGLLGIGGGMVTGPLLLSMGVPPQVSVATSSFMIFFTSSSTAAQFSIIGAIPWDYGLWYIVFGIGSGMMGQYLIGKLLKKYNKASLVVFIVVGTIVVSCMFMLGTGVYRTILDIQSGASMGFRKFC